MTTRVGILTYALDRPQSGISRYTVELIRALHGLRAEYDFEIVLLTAGDAGPLAVLQLRRIALPGCKLLPGLLALGNLHIPRIARQEKLDVIHDTIGITPFGLGAGPARRIVTIHDIIPLSFPGFSTRLDTLIYRHWLPRVLPRVDGVITDSEASRNDIVRYLKVKPEMIHPIHIGVNPLYRPGIPAAVQEIRAKYALPDQYLLYVGSIEARKNLSRVLEAFALLRTEYADGRQAKLVIIGMKKWKYQHIMDTLARLELNDAVIFTGYVPEDDLPLLYSGARGLVFPSLYEGFGLPVAEAMACGTAVLTSNVSSLPEVAGDAALQVDPYDVRAIMQGMARLLFDDVFSATLIEKGDARAAMFDWRQTARRTLSVYRKALAR